MRHLVILHGSDSAGIDRFIAHNDALPHVLDYAMLEALFGEQVEDRFGAPVMDPFCRRRARHRILSLTREKLFRGSLIILRLPSDNSQPLADAVARIVNDALMFRYQCLAIGFGTPVPGQIPEGVPEYTPGRDHDPTQGAGHEAADPCMIALDDLLEPAPVDLSRYRNMVFIGDIHGCLETFIAFAGSSGPDPDTAYIFTGDLVNKGPMSGPLLAHLIRYYAPHPGCLWLIGNHDRQLESWACQPQPHLSETFRDTTLSSIIDAGITQDAVREFLAAFRDVVRLTWKDRAFLVCHGGIARLPGQLHRLPAIFFQNGTGADGLDIDAAWETGVFSGENPDPKRLVQVHGHRNKTRRPILAAAGSYNLEDRIDQGGPMRALIYRHDGGTVSIHAVETENHDISTAGTACEPRRFSEAS